MKTSRSRILVEASQVKSSLHEDIHDVDLSDTVTVRIPRNEYGTAVWKSTNDGDDWVDETGDLVTVSPGPSVWYETDFYFVTRGEGVTVKRNFEA